MARLETSEKSLQQSGNQTNLPFSSRHILEDLGRLLVTPRDFAQAQKRLSTLEHESYSLLQLCKRNKVSAIFYENLVQLQARYPDLEIPYLPDAAAMATERLEIRDRAQAEMLRVISAAHAELGVQPVILKGYSLQILYPAPYERWMNDIDLWFPAVEPALQVYEWMCDHGYEVDPFELPWFKQRGNHLYGHLILRRRYEGRVLRFDLHFGNYSIGYSGYLDCDVAAECETHHHGDIALRLPDSTHRLLIVTAHMLSDGFVHIKDINDVVSLLLSRAIHWSTLLPMIERNQLQAPLRRLLLTIQRLYDHPVILAEVALALQGLAGSVEASYWPLFERRRTTRAILNACHTFRFETHHNNNGTFRSAMASLACFVYYMRHFHPGIRTRSVAEALGERLLAHPALRQGKVTTSTCVRLVSIGHWKSLATHEPPGIQRFPYCPGRLTYFEALGAHIIASNRHAFLPTVDYVATPREVRAALDLITFLEHTEEDTHAR